MWPVPLQLSMRNVVLGCYLKLFLFLFLFFFSMVSSYLVHHGYCATATAFARMTETTIQEEQASIKNRQSKVNFFSPLASLPAPESVAHSFSGCQESSLTLSLPSWRPACWLQFLLPSFIRCSTGSQWPQPSQSSLPNITHYESQA